MTERKLNVIQSMLVASFVGVIMWAVAIIFVYSLMLAVPSSEPLTLKERAEYECLNGISEAACDWLEHEGHDFTKK